MSQHEFLRKYPNGKVPRNSSGYNKTFVCRRGCNTRTSTYTDEFVWEDVYSGKEDIGDLLELVRSKTRSTRKRNHGVSLEADYVATRPEQDDDYHSDDDAVRQKVGTPRKRQKTTKVVTPSNRR